MKNRAKSIHFPMVYLLMIAALVGGAARYWSWSSVARAQYNSSNPESNQETQQTATLTSYRPRHQNGDYSPFVQTAVPKDKQNDDKEGPGIRINKNANDPNYHPKENLVEILVERKDETGDLMLQRENDSLRVWKNGDRTNEIVFTDNTTGALQFGTAKSLTVYVEWASAAHGLASLKLVKGGSNPLTVLDSIRFHTFKSVIICFGGLLQTAPAANSGTGQTAIEVYKAGYDPHWYPETDKAAGQSEAETAVTKRGVDEIVLLGYSFGGRNVRDLASASATIRQKLKWTGYVDARHNDGIYLLVGAPIKAKPDGSPKHTCSWETNSLTPGAETTENLAGVVPELHNMTPMSHTDIDVNAQVKGWNQSGITSSLSTR